MPGVALILFALAFVAGPLLGAALLQLPAKLPVMVTLSALVFVAAGAALWLRERDVLGGMVSLWIGWVLAVVLVALALRRRLPGGTARRWTTLGALFACALPWFGLATALTME